MTETLTLDTFRLSHGAHGDTFCGAACLVELSNLIAARRVVVPDAATPACGLVAAPFSDDHPSISRVIRAYAIGLNDAWNDEARQRLLPYAPRLLCTNTGRADDETRAWLATDWLVRVYQPAFLRLAGLTEHAVALSGPRTMHGDPIVAPDLTPEKLEEVKAAL